MSRYVLGINGGGTHTSLILADEQLTVLARAEVGPSNANYVGLEAARSALDQGIDQVLRLAGLTRRQISAVGAGLAGVDRPADHVVFEDVFGDLLPGAVLALDNDAVPALVAAAGRQFGVVTISGTGMIAVGMNAQRQRARSGGWGHFVDHGSGYWIARETLAAITAAHDESGPQTGLVARVLARYGVESAPQLIDWLYVPGRRIDEVAALAADTVALAESGDVVAVRIIARAADLLAGAAITVARRLGFGDHPFPLVMSGSLFTHSPLLRDLFVSTVQSTVAAAVPLITEREAALGAAMMALEKLGVPPPDSFVAALPSALPRRATEQRNRLTRDAHRRPTLDFVSMMNIEDSRVPQLIAPQLPRIAALIDAMAARFRQGGRIFFAGAGTSGRLAVLDAAECGPTFGTTPDQVVGILAGGPDALSHSIEDVEDSEQAGRAEIAARSVGPLDSVIGLAASGSTPFVCGVLREAAARGALTGSIANTIHAPISALAQHPIELPTGPEVVMGSTRLKAGTAQKLVLNMLSTGVMLRVGRVYSNLMVNMQASNAKLRERAKVIVAEITGLSLEQSGDLLAQADGEMKTAIAAALLGITPDEARTRLAAVGGDLSRCVPED